MLHRRNFFFRSPCNIFYRQAESRRFYIRIPLEFSDCRVPSTGLRSSLALGHRSRCDGHIGRAAGGRKRKTFGSFCLSARKSLRLLACNDTHRPADKDGNILAAGCDGSNAQPRRKSRATSSAPLPALRCRTLFWPRHLSAAPYWLRPP